MYRCFLLFLLPFTSALILSSVWNSFVNGVYYIADELLTTYDESVPEDARLNISQLITKYKYKFEEHTVITEDGYILNVHRIPYGGRNVRKNNLTVLLMHGMLDSSDSWVLLGPDRALAYVLADAGFDVWMGNARGNKYASGHVALDPGQSEFWKFTWEEIGLYDLPATIDYILNVTNKNSLYYIGYSQGTTSYYVMASMKTEYNKKVELMFSLAPEAWMGNIKSPIVRLFSPANSILGYLLSDFNVLTSGTDFFNRISSILCTVLPLRCDNFLHEMFGLNDKTNHEAISPVILGHMPTGSSTLQFVHYGQLVQSGGFHRFDYGSKGNIVNYGTNSPPIYNCSNINVPIVLFYSDNDWLSDAEDVRILENELPIAYGINMGDFNHLDYVYSTKSIVIYREIISVIECFVGFRPCLIITR